MRALNQDTTDRSETLLAENLEVVAPHPLGQRPLLSIDRLQLSAGQIVVVHGPSGCGKTTLLRTLAGLIDPAAGDVSLCGRSAREWGWPRFRSLMPLVAQQPVLLDGSVEANLRRPFAYRSADGKTYDADDATRMLEAVGLPRAVVGERAKSLSVGEQQRVCLIRALLIEPKVLLLDEPMSALDNVAAEQVEVLLREAATDRGLSVLAATHQVQRARLWCDGDIELRPLSEARA
jgi:putative ABC transport system ATP-binding protein